MRSLEYIRFSGIWGMCEPHDSNWMVVYPSYSEPAPHCITLDIGGPTEIRA